MVGPSASPLRGVASNRLVLRWLKTVVVSDEEKAPVEVSGGDREGERERTAVEASRMVDGIRTRATNRSWDESGGDPCAGQAVPGV